MRFATHTPQPDPLTQIGDESWSDYYIEATVSFNLTGPYPLPQAPARALPAALPLPGRPVRLRESVWRAAQGLPMRAPIAAAAAASNTLTLLPCDPTDPSQAFTFSPANAGYLVNGAAGTCLDVNGCGTLVDLFACVSGPSGSSCGAPAGSYPNLQWTYSAGSGQLASGMAGAPMLTALPNASVYALPPGSAAGAQAWDYVNASQLRLRGSPGAGACLSTAPTQRYAKVCLRVASFDGFTAAPIAATCLRVLARGAWEVVGPSGALLGTGALPAPFVPQAPHVLRLGASGPYLEAWVDGASVLQLSDASVSVGNAALGTGWHGSRWSNFSIGAM